MSEYETIGTYNTHPVKIVNCRTTFLDIVDKQTVFSRLKRLKPDYVVHCAAMTNVDLCERSPKRAWAINVEGTKHLTQICAEINARMIYVSTNYVFDGKKGAYKENDKPNPINHYSRTKWEGEKVVQSLLDDFTIARVSLYGLNIMKDNSNFITQSIDNLAKGMKINALIDQYNSPILANNCAEALLAIIKYEKSGIFHIGGSERSNRYDLMKAVTEIFGFDTELVVPITTDMLNLAARRPKDTSFDISKAKKELGVELHNVRTGLKYMRSLKEEGYLESFVSF